MELINNINPINIFSNLKRVESVHAGLSVLVFVCLVVAASERLRMVSVYWIRATCWSVGITSLLGIPSSGMGVGGKNCGMVGMPAMGGMVGMTA